MGQVSPIENLIQVALPCTCEKFGIPKTLPSPPRGESGEYFGDSGGGGGGGGGGVEGAWPSRIWRILCGFSPICVCVASRKTHVNPNQISFDSDKLEFPDLRDLRESKLDARTVRARAACGTPAGGACPRGRNCAPLPPPCPCTARARATHFARSQRKT